MTLRRRLAVVLSALALLAGGVAPTAAAASQPFVTPSGANKTPVAATDLPGDCELSTVTCKPGLAGSCSGYSSQITPPSTILVAVRTSATALTITSVDFETYVEDVLPNEWAASYDGDSLKAGAVAVKSYAWYWVTHFGGYLNGDAKQCFDVTDDQDFQVYVKDSRLTKSMASRTTSAVEQTWSVAARYNGAIAQTFYTNDLTTGKDTCREATNGVTLSQDGSQACVETNTGNKYNVILGYYYYKPVLQYATTLQLRAQHDFQFLARSTRVTFNSGVWSLDDGYGTVLRYGLSGDVPTTYTLGDGFARIGVFRPSNHTWYLATPTGTTGKILAFGLTGDVPVQAQYNGLTQQTVLAVYRPSNQYWYEATSTGAVAASFRWGLSGDIPVPGRYTSTAADQAAVFRPSNGTWYVRGGATVQWGLRGDIPVPADYNGDGLTDLAVYRPSTHTFYVRGQASVPFGVAGDLPVTGDFNGDGRADLVVYRPSNHTWYTYQAAPVAFGASGATPIGRAPYHD